MRQPSTGTISISTMRCASWMKAEKNWIIPRCTDTKRARFTKPGRIIPELSTSMLPLPSPLAENRRPWDGLSS